MPKIITKETHDEILRLHFEEGLSFSEISKRVGVGRNKVGEICWDDEARRADQELEEERKRKREQSAQKIEPEVFARLDNGETLVDLVKGGVCSIDTAKELGERYVELKNMSRPNLEILEARMENASHLVRCALGIAKMKIICPLCREEGELVLREIDGVKRWVCNSCGQLPF